MIVSLPVKMNKSIFVFLCTLFCTFAQNCFLKYTTDLPDKESVLLWTKLTGYDLIEPRNEGIILLAYQQIALACPGTRNQFANVSSNLVTATCVGDKTLKVGTINFLLSELGCSTSVTGQVLLSQVECGTGGIIKHIGHNISNEFEILFDICYDDLEGGALYAVHIIYGSAINYAHSESSRPSFKVGGLASGVSADNAYKQTTQKTTFTTILGSTSLADKYIFTNPYLARGHLAPDADMIYVSSQWSTYFYINTVPQWQQINNGNWKSLEDSVRDVAAKTGQDFQVYTGSHEVLALEDVNGTLAEIYLSNGKLPVPKFIWKVFYSLLTRKGIAFVSLNNPFVTQVTSEHYICTDICNQYAWGSTSWKNSSKGLIYCCEINGLRNTVANVPQLFVTGVQEANILTFPSA